MRIQAKRLKKVLAALSITGLLSFGVSTIASATDPTVSVDVSYASGTTHSGTATGSILSSDTIKISVPGLVVGKEAYMTSASAVVTDSADVESTVPVSDHPHSMIYDVGGVGTADFYISSWDMFPDAGQVDLTTYKSFAFSFTITVKNAPAVGSVTLDLNSVKTSAVTLSGKTITRDSAYDAIQPRYLCWAFKGADGVSEIAFLGAKVELTYKSGSKTKTVTPTDLAYPFSQVDQDGKFNYCVYSEFNEDPTSTPTNAAPGNLTKYKSAKLSVTFTKKSTFNTTAFASAFTAKGLTMSSDGLSCDYDTATNKSTFSVGVDNNTADPIDFQFANPKVAGKALTINQWTTNTVQSTESAWLTLGTLSGNSCMDLINASVTIDVLLPSNFNTTSLGTALSAKSLTFSQPGGLTWWYDSEAKKTYFTLKAVNSGNSKVALNIKNPKVGNTLLKNSEPKIVVPAQDERYANLGWISGDYGYGRTDQVSATFETAVASTFDKSAVTLPAGVTITSDSLDFYYTPSDGWPVSARNTTTPNLTLRNGGSSAVTLKISLGYKVGTGSKAKSYSGRGFEVVTIDPNQSATISGWNDSDPTIPGDIRSGATIKLTGTIAAVSANTVSTSALVVPSPATKSDLYFSYDEVSKKTTVRVNLNEPRSDANQTTNGQNLISQGGITLNGVAQGKHPLAMGCWQCGGGDQTVVQRTAVLGVIDGDARYGQTVTVSGAFTYIDPVSFEEQTTSETYGNSGCGVNSPADWIYDVATNKTTITYNCGNYSANDLKFNLSGVTGTYQTGPSAPSSFTTLSGISSVKVKSNNWANLSVLQGNGDLRAGTISLVFTGVIKSKK